MKKIPFNMEWERTSTVDSMGLKNGRTETVNLPDDYIIHSKRSPAAVSGAFSGFFCGGSAVYKKKFTLPEEWRQQNVLLNIDGAYMTSDVAINTERIKFNAYGYSPFFAELTPWLKEENILEIGTENHQPNSRWYTGGGIYRQIHILIGGKYYFHPWSVFISTPEITDENAVVRVEFGITNTANKNAAATVKVELRYGGEAVAAREERVYLAAGKETVDHIQLKIPKPKRWSPDTPELYEAVLSIIENKEIIDTHIQLFGVRTLEFSATEGMRLNGKPITMKGGCIHHDHALLGAAAYPAAEERKLRILKALGYNAIRTSHNPVSETFLDLCDKIGFLVLEEAFDCWLKGKTGNDYHRDFRDWWKRDLTAMVTRDRNHPCVFAWSVGNEIREVEGSEIGVQITKDLAACIRALDFTRPVTLGQHGVVNYERAGLSGKYDFAALQAMVKKNPWVIDGIDYWGAQTERHFEQLDLAGYNYIWPRYRTDAEKYSSRIIIATETHPFTMYDYWKAAIENPNCIGDFIWTAYDNIGEAGTGRVTYEPEDNEFLGSYPWLSNGQGDCDLDGNRKPQSYYHKILWGLDQGIHVFSYHPSHYGKYSRGTGWHWNDVSREWTFGKEYIGKPVKMEAYADCDEVEFILNGKSLGRVKPKKYIAMMEAPYEPGTLEVVAYKNGSQTGKDTLQTTTEPARIMLISEKEGGIKADGLDLAFIRVEIHDSEGRLVTNRSIPIAAEAEGARIWLGSGTPCTDENYGTGQRRTWQGKALIAVGASYAVGDIQIRVSAPGLEEEKLTLQCS